MRRSIPVLCFAATLALGASLSAQSVTTDPVGFTTTSLPANADTFVSIPFTRPAEFVGAITSAGGTTITVSGTPFQANQFVYVAGSQPKTYYALVGPAGTTNPKEGHVYPITGNGTGTLTVVTPAGDDLNGIPVNSQVLVVPYWTLASVFPASDANVSFVPSPSQFNRLTQIFIPNYSGSGINLSATATYYFLNGAWRKFGQPITDDHGDDTLLPGGYITVRNAATGTTLTALGAVLVKKQTVPLLTSTSTQVDNFVSVTRPINVALNDLGLISSGVFASSPSQFNRIDQLFVFDNSAPGINKSASGTYYYSNGAWRKFGQNPGTDFGTDTIAAGTGFVIRKGITADGLPLFWQNSPTY